MRISTAKSYLKDLIWDLPSPVARVVIEASCSARLLNPSYSVYLKMGRPSQILSGPFRGMAYQPVAAGSSWLPKVVGSYEKELHPHVEWAAHQPFDLIVDVGSAEGYYAVGLARMIPSIPIHCFDTDPRANDLLVRNARMNGVGDRVVLGGFCSPETLDGLLKGSRMALVICDCEGGELDLLVPEAAPELRRAVVIAEVHDYYGADEIGRTIRERFASTHEIEKVPITPRSRDDLPASLAALTDGQADAALDEGRPPMGGWLVMRPRA